MVSKILDATAFYAGIPFVSNDSFMTTSIVYEEIQHIKAKQGALEMLQQTNRLQTVSYTHLTLPTNREV